MHKRVNLVIGEGKRKRRNIFLYPVTLKFFGAGGEEALLRFKLDLV